MKIIKVFQDDKREAAQLTDACCFQAEAANDLWPSWFNRLGNFSPDFMETREEGEQQVRLDLPW